MTLGEIGTGDPDASATGREHLRGGALRSIRRPAVVALVGAAVTLIVALTGIAVVDLLAHRIVFGDLRSYLARTASATAGLIDGDEFVRITRPEQETTEQYTRASRPLRVLLESNPDIRFAYSGVTTGTNMHFVLDGSPVGARNSAGISEHARPMDEDVASPGEIEVTRTRRVTVEAEPSATAWGMGIRAQAPIFARSGQMVGYVGLTMRADRYSHLIHRVDVAAVLGAAIAACLAFVTGVGIWSTERARVLAENALARERDRLRVYAEALDGADDEARRATAAELHDGVGQILAGQGMILKAARTKVGDDPVGELIERAADASREAQAGIHKVIQDMSPPELECATLSEMMNWVTKLFAMRYGFAVEWNISGKSDLPRANCLLIYRIVRELTHNAYKHSGSTRAKVEITIGTDSIEISVVDEGIGFDPHQLVCQVTGPFGLSHIGERVRAAGGTMRVASTLGAGCSVHVCVPLNVGRP